MRGTTMLAMLAAAAAVGAGTSAPASAQELRVLHSLGLADSTSSTGDIAVERRGRFAVVAGDGGVQKVRLGASAMTLLGTTDRAGGRTVVLHPRGRYAYVLDGDGTALHVVDVRRATPKLVRTLGVPDLAPDLGFDLAVSPRGNALYVGYLGGLQELSLADPARPRRAGRAPRATEQYAGAIAITPDGRRVIGSVSHGSRDYLLRYDVSKPGRPAAVRGLKPLPFEPYALAVSTDGTRTYVAGGGGVGQEGDVAQLRTRDLRLQRRLSGLPQQPSQIAVAPDGERVYTAIAAALGQPPLGVFGGVPLSAIGFSGGLEWPNGLTVSPAGPARGQVLVLSQATATTPGRTLSAMAVG